MTNLDKRSDVESVEAIKFKKTSGSSAVYRCDTVYLASVLIQSELMKIARGDCKKIFKIFLFLRKFDSSGVSKV